jgi:hypothetical protein
MAGRLAWLAAYPAGWPWLCSMAGRLAVAAYPAGFNAVLDRAGRHSCAWLAVQRLSFLTLSFISPTAWSTAIGELPWFRPGCLALFRPVSQEEPRRMRQMSSLERTLITNVPWKQDSRAHD